MTEELDPRHAVYVGSFDPLTLGHHDIITRGSRIFSKLTVGIGINPEKKPLFSPDERLSIITELVTGLHNVEVVCFEGLAVGFTRKCGAAVMLRGIRTLTDIDAEFTMSLANRAMATDIETVFLMANEKFSHISSTLIKQIAQMSETHPTEKLRAFIPEYFIAPMLKKYRDE